MDGSGMSAESTNAIAREIYRAVERLTDDPEILSILGSYRDTLDDSEILSLLRDYNATGKALHKLREAN